MTEYICQNLQLTSYSTQSAEYVAPESEKKLRISTHPTFIQYFTEGSRQFNKARKTN